MRPNKANIYRLMKAMIQSNYRPSKSALLKRAEMKFTPTALNRTPDELKEIFMLCKKYDISPSANMFTRKPLEIVNIIALCKEHNIPITGSMFQRNDREFEDILNYCIEHKRKISASILFSNRDEIEEITEICEKYGVEVIDSMFKRKPYEIIEILDICKEKGLKVSGNTFRRNSNEFKSIVEECERQGIEPKGTVFKCTAEEIKDIFEIYKELLNTKPSNNAFNKKPSEVRKIIELCLKHNIEITGILYDKTKDELEETINFLLGTYGKEFLIPQIIIYSPEHLGTVLAYMFGKRELQTVINSPSILKLTVTEIVEREIFVKARGEELVINGVFNPIFGWSKTKFNDELKKQIAQRR